VNGRPGRRAVEERVPGLREELGLDFVVANGENAADGLGITPKIADALLASGVDVITLGNHVWRRREIIPYLSGTDRVEEAKRETPVIVVDFHGEATSEKVALARYLDGQVTAVFGTHTHVQTNDARVQPGGTAALSDAGMTGPHDSVIGVKAELAIQRMRTGIPVRFETAEGGVRLEGALLECDGSGRATSCETFRVSV